MHYIKLFEEAISALNDNLYVFEQVYPDIYKLLTHQLNTRLMQRIAHPLPEIIS